MNAGPYIYTAGGEWCMKQVIQAMQCADELGGPDTPQEYHRLMLDVARECLARAQACRDANPDAFGNVVGFWKEYGFRLYNTGGGCMAMEKQYRNEWYTLITSPEDADVPDSITSPHMVGIYTPDGELVGDVKTYPSALHAVEALRREGAI